MKWAFPNGEKVLRSNCQIRVKNPLIVVWDGGKLFCISVSFQSATSLFPYLWSLSKYCRPELSTKLLHISSLCQYSNVPKQPRQSGGRICLHVRTTLSDCFLMKNRGMSNVIFLLPWKEFRKKICLVMLVESGVFVVVNIVKMKQLVFHKWSTYSFFSFFFIHKQLVS